MPADVAEVFSSCCWVNVSILGRGCAWLIGSLLRIARPSHLTLTGDARPSEIRASLGSVILVFGARDVALALPDV